MTLMKEGPTNLALRVLEQIRDGVAVTNQRLDQTNQRLDETNQRLDDTRKELLARQTETEIRLATEIVAVVGAVHSLRDAMLADRDLRHAVDDHEQRLRTIERKTG